MNPSKAATILGYSCVGAAIVFFRPASDKARSVVLPQPAMALSSCSKSGKLANND